MAQSAKPLTARTGTAEAVARPAARPIPHRARSRRAWASAVTWADLGERVVSWLHGGIRQTPGHCGPPCEETIPLVPVLTAACRAGFVTDGCAGSTDLSCWPHGREGAFTLMRASAGSAPGQRKAPRPILGAGGNQGQGTGLYGRRR
jgi:hypothetical protein